MQREIPKLQVLSLRAVGSLSCSAEATFAADQKTGEPSKASKLLRAFHQRPAALPADAEAEDSAMTVGGVDATDKSKEEDSPKTIRDISMARTVCVGKGCSRRAQANDVDLNHPIIAQWYTDEATGNRALVMEHGSPALDCLQSYIDSLVELGRMDDGRLGLHFFEEWKANVLVAAGRPVPTRAEMDAAAAAELASQEEALAPPPRKRTRRRSSAASSSLPTAAAVEATETATNNNPSSSTTTLRVRVKSGPPPPLGSLSLNNCAIAEETIEAMRDSGMGIHIGVLDLSGIYGLNDVMLEQLLPHCPNIQRLSFKNCRRVTVASLQILVQYQTKLQFLDIGGTYNITPDEVIDTLVVGSKANKKNPPCPELVELNVSGLGWNDHLMKTVVLGTNDEEDDVGEGGALRSWKALSFGFSMNLTSLALRQSLSKVSSSLISLALHFCEFVVDNALMGMLGRNLPHVRFLDVRGNSALNSMTGWYDGRASVHRNPGDGRAFADHRPDGGDNDEDDDHNEEEGGSSPVVVQELIVLARFSGITKASLEDTLRIHPLHASKLKCILDSDGVGVGIYR